MKIRPQFILYVLLLMVIPSFAQNDSGKLIIGQRTNKPTTRAVIIGISDYEDEQIPDLKFAHRDAQAFANYLSDLSNKNISEEHVQVFLNEQATGANVHKALYWLLKESQKNDECLIYFSGHGDVETIYSDEPGHFLVYDSPSSIYQINSLRIEDLQRIITTLTTVKEVKVTVFTDACRSGKLAGYDINGTQATAESLSKQFANEVKVMSCQANQFSIEGEQWGGGRGLFSFHLIEALVGLADNNENQEISLKELQRYLEDRFDEETLAARQSPVVIGDKNAVLSIVDPYKLESLIAEKSGTNSNVAEASGFASTQSTERDNNDLLEYFYNALKEKKLLEEYEANNSAEYFYNQIASREDLSSKLPLVKGDFIAALQNEAQHVINQYLELDIDDIKKRWYSDGSDMVIYAKYLKKSTGLLGEQHFLYRHERAKQLYFEVVVDRMKFDIGDSLVHTYKPLVSKLNEALSYEPRAAYVFNELGLILEKQGEYEQAIENFHKALEISPTWALPYNNIAFSYNRLNQPDSALYYANLSLEISPEFHAPVYNLSEAYYKKREYQKSIELDLEYNKIFPDDCTIINNLGTKHFLIGDTLTAIKYYEDASRCDRSYTSPLKNKVWMYYYLGDYARGIDSLKNYLNNEYMDKANVYDLLGLMYESSKEYEQAIESYLSAIDLKANLKSSISSLISCYLESNNATKAIEYVNYYSENVEDTNPKIYLKLAGAHALQKDYDDFISAMQKAIDLGFRDLKLFEENKFIQSIIDSEAYNTILTRLQSKQ